MEIDGFLVKGRKEGRVLGGRSGKYFYVSISSSFSSSFSEMTSNL